MPYVTPMQVMEAVFSKQQISAIMTMRRHDYWNNDDKDGKHEYAKIWAMRPDKIEDVIYSIERYRKQSTAKCLKEDPKWCSRLTTTEFWEEQIYATERANRLLDEAAQHVHHAICTLREHNVPYTNMVADKLDITFPRDKMPEEETEFNFLA